MAKDITIQLRELASLMERGNGRSTVYGAATEIERLQALVEHLSSQLRLQIKANDKATEANYENTI